MASYLLDTHIFLWWISDSKKLNKKIFNIILDGTNRIYVSSASIWEIAIKEALGKIEINCDLEDIIENNEFLELKISAKCASFTRSLENIHKDPFDRILIAQAIKNNLILITADKNIAEYNGVKVLLN